MNTKRRGELSEAAFILSLPSRLWRRQALRRQRALRLHPRFWPPDSGPRLWRVQLKCTETKRARGCDIQPIYSIYGRGKRGYTSDQIDVLVVHIVPLDTWYVLPVEAYAPRKSLRFYPDAIPNPKLPARFITPYGHRRARFEQFREAWKRQVPPLCDPWPKVGRQNFPGLRSCAALGWPHLHRSCDPHTAPPTRPSSCFFNNLRPVHCTSRPLNPNFRRFPAFRVYTRTPSPTIILTHSTHRNFQVSTWEVLFARVRVPHVSRFSRHGIAAEGQF